MDRRSRGFESGRGSCRTKTWERCTDDGGALVVAVTILGGDGRGCRCVVLVMAVMAVRFVVYGR